MIYITGDTHGEYDGFLNRIYKFPFTENDTVIVTGDFGFVWNEPQAGYFLTKLAEEPFTIAFVDGNHEDFDLLYSYPEEDWNGGRVHRVSDNIFHLMRGQLFNIEGKTFFTMGGAYSIDKPMRTAGISWWQQELPNNEEYNTAKKTLEGCGYKVDYVVTHTVPQSVIHYLGISPDHHDAELTGYFEWLYNNLVFGKWFAGHFHVNKEIRGNVLILSDDVFEIK